MLSLDYQTTVEQLNCMIEWKFGISNYIEELLVISFEPKDCYIEGYGDIPISYSEWIPDSLINEIDNIKQHALRYISDNSLNSWAVNDIPEFSKEFALVSDNITFLLGENITRQPTHEQRNTIIKQIKELSEKFKVPFRHFENGKSVLCDLCLAIEDHHKRLTAGEHNLDVSIGKAIQNVSEQMKKYPNPPFDDNACRVILRFHAEPINQLDRYKFELTKLNTDFSSFQQQSSLLLGKLLVLENNYNDIAILLEQSENTNFPDIIRRMDFNHAKEEWDQLALYVQNVGL